MSTRASQAGSGGLFLLAAVSAIADVDALTLSMARLAERQVASGDAATAILVAASVNTTTKAAIAACVGGTRIGTIVGSVHILAIATYAADVSAACTGLAVLISEIQSSSRANSLPGRHILKHVEGELSLEKIVMT